MIKILTCSAADYAANQGRPLTDYEFVEVDGRRFKIPWEECNRDLEVIVAAVPYVLPKESIATDGTSYEERLRGTGLRRKDRK
jgi:hypothetical protein